MDVLKLIEIAGGHRKLAGLLGVSRTTVLGWRASGSIPAERAVQICRELGFDPHKVLPLVSATKPAKRPPRAHGQAPGMRLVSDTVQTNVPPKPSPKRKTGAMSDVTYKVRPP